MAKNTKADSRKIRSKFFSFLFFFLISISAYAYIDQIVIETPSMAKTIYDIRVHALIRHLYEDKKTVDTSTPEWMASSFEDERTNYVQQFLAQNYVIENDLNLKPAPNEIQRALKSIDDAFKNEADKKKTLDSLEITANDLQQWVTNRLIFEKFLTNTIQNRVIITDEKISNHYQSWKSTKYADKPLEQIHDKVRQDLVQALLKEEFEKWVDQEKRREKMILKVVAKS